MTFPNQTETATATLRDPDSRRELLSQLQQALTSLQFGQIVLYVQDGAVVRVERTEKVRLNTYSGRR